MAARIRFFTIIGDPTGFAYLEPLAGSPYGISVAPIGPCFLTAPPWNAVAKFFARPTAPIEEIVNIVCAPRGALLGQRSATYEPRTAFSELWTPGCPNVAVVAAGAAGAGDEEALRQYDVVVVPGDIAQARLTDAGVPAVRCTPEDFLNIIGAYMPDQQKHEGNQLDAQNTTSAH